MRQLYLLAVLFLTCVLTCLGQNNVLSKGNSYLDSEQYEKAEQTFRAGIKTEPNNFIYQCQLSLVLIEQKRYSEAETLLNNILLADSNNVAAIWYSGIGNFYNSRDRQAIRKFERALTLIDKKSGQYYSANWFIGNCYSKLLKTEGLAFTETDRMLECYEEYLRLQPSADDAGKIREYIKRKKQRRPAENVKRWVDL